MNSALGKLLKEACLIFIGSLACGFFINSVSPAGISLFGSWDTTMGVISANAKHDVVVHEREIQNVETAKAMFDQGGILFVDARAPEQYEQGHIGGAISIPLRQFDACIEFLFEKYPTETPMITYCSGRECADSHELAQLLEDVGYADVKVFIDGYPAWKKKGYPVE